MSKMLDSSEDKLRNNIIRLRESHRWTQADLAKKINVDNSIISKIENGVRHVSGAELNSLSDVFEVSTDYLLGKSKSKNSVDAMLDDAMSNDGQPMTENDREIIKSMIEAYLKNKK